MKDGKPVLISFVTVNRELSFLRFLLNSAVDEEILEESPRFTSKRKNASLIKSEKNRKRERNCANKRVSGYVEKHETTSVARGNQSIGQWRESRSKLLWQRRVIIQ